MRLCTGSLVKLTLAFDPLVYLTNWENLNGAEKEEKKILNHFFFYVNRFFVLLC